MGVDASVMCNCYQNKQVTPPVPEDWLCIDEEGGLALIDEQSTPENWGQLNDWMETCCEHENLEFACERISNWSGYRLFQSAIRELGAEQYPVLTAELPMNNGGLTSPEASRQALLELDKFVQLEKLGTEIVLVETETGEVIRKSITDYEGEFMWSGIDKTRTGIDEAGFFVKHSKTGKEIFRAKKFEELVYEKRSWLFRKKTHVVWKDLESSNEFQTKHLHRLNALVSMLGTENETEFHVEQRASTPAEYNYIVEPLRVVFKASVETNNPVRWE